MNNDIIVYIIDNYEVKIDTNYYIQCINSSIYFSNLMMEKKKLCKNLVYNKNY